MCVIAKRLDCPHRLAQATGGGHFACHLHIQAHLSSFRLVINRNPKHKLQELHVGKPCSRRGFQRVFCALLGDPQRASARLKAEVSKLAMLLRKYACYWHMLVKSVFYAPPSALAEHSPQVE